MLHLSNRGIGEMRVITTCCAKEWKVARGWFNHDFSSPLTKFIVQFIHDWDVSISPRNRDSVTRPCSLKINCCIFRWIIAKVGPTRIGNIYHILFESSTYIFLYFEDILVYPRCIILSQHQRTPTNSPK